MNTEWNKENAAEWLRKKEWQSGLKLKVREPLDAVSFAVQYHKNKGQWDKMSAFIRETDLAAIEPGKYTIDGDDIYAIITEAPSKTFEQSGWEAHRKYIDLQYIISGKEKMGIVSLSEATVTKPYDDEKDYALFSAKGRYYTATPEAFFLFFPNDVHRPNILVKGHEMVKKLVIKIRIAE